MKASQKRFCLSGGIFAVLLLCTGLVFRRVPSTERFYAVGVLGVLMSFLMKLALIAAVFPNRVAAVVRHEEGVAKHRE
jgi:hypothetical protein